MDNYYNGPSYSDEDYSDYDYEEDYERIEEQQITYGLQQKRRRRDYDDLEDIANDRRLDYSYEYHR